MPRPLTCYGATAIVAMVAVAATSDRLAAQVSGLPDSVRDSGSVATYQRAGVRPGARVRVTDRSGHQTDGRVWSVTADSLRLGLANQGFATVAWSDVRRYEVARGRARGRGALRGTLVGGALGVVLIGLAAHEDATSGGDVMLPAMLFAVPAAVLLTGIGAGVGTLAAPVRWTPAVVVQRQSASNGGPNGPVGIAAQADVWSLGLSARF